MTYGFLLPLICDLKVNRFDLPFTTLTGLVHCDRYHDNWIHFPAHWRDANFSGVLPKGTPVAQCMPVKPEHRAAPAPPQALAPTSREPWYGRCV
jgi:hypothetical protein